MTAYEGMFVDAVVKVSDCLDSRDMEQLHIVRGQIADRKFTDDEYGALYQLMTIVEEAIEDLNPI